MPRAALRAVLPGILTILILAAVAMALPWIGVSSYVRTLIYYVAYYLVLGQAWNLMSGFTGYVSFAHGAIAGIGAYGVIIALNAGLPIAVSIVFGAVAAVVVFLVVGATSLRLRGISFTFATLFFQDLVLLVLRKLPFTGGPGGIVLQNIISIRLAYILMIAAAGIATMAIYLLRRSRLGVRALAIKSDENAASAIGIDAPRLKLVLFCASAAMAGLGGAIHGIFTASLYPDEVFSIDLSIVALAVPLVGGVTTASGPFIGALLYVGIREALQVIAPSLHLTIVGLLILAVVLFMRDGIVPAVLRRFRQARAVRLVTAEGG